MEGHSQRFGMRLLIVDDEIGEESMTGRAVDVLMRELKRRNIEIVVAKHGDDAISVIKADPSLQCVLLDWDLGTQGHAASEAVLIALRKQNRKIPVFLLADRSVASTVPIISMSKVDDFVWLLEDTADFIGGRVQAAIEKYRANLLPPMFRALAKFARVHEYSWHTPGHTGGTGFLKSPVGRAFFEYFGEPLLRSDLSISVGDLGSLLDHSGPIGESEKYVAQVFGAHRTYHVTNGSSTSNRIILMSSVSHDQIALCDRNCHKSAEHAITMSGAVPVYMMPTRNHLGIIGPIPPERLTKTALQASIKTSSLAKDATDQEPKHAIITNSTYDGLCYNVARVEELLGSTVDRLHFDEAWYGYARFNPIYAGRHAMHGDPKTYDASRPTVFATQSTHKLLTALSQASFIHVRDGRKPIPHGLFNETFMMHASTSPNYAIIASNDVAASMMDGPGGKTLTNESIEEAVAFRQMIARLHDDFAAKGEWFFNCWQPDTVIDPKSGKAQPFYAASAEHLATDSSCWVLKPGAAWHGFGDLEDGYCMLDPIKVSVLTPGVAAGGALKSPGIPASILSNYLTERGIVGEKTTDFTILFLFSIGITKGKWGTLVAGLGDFKRDYDENVPLDTVLPSLMQAHGKRYAGMGLKDICDEMFAAMGELKTTAMMAAGFSNLPQAEMSPTKAYQQLVRGEVEHVTLDKLANRVVATGVVPYPPGIPLLMPGENAGPAEGPVIGYLKSLEAFDRRFPGFAHDTHGVEPEDGEYRIYVLKP